MPAATSLALEPDSLVLVTGASGFQGSHVVDQLLAQGYRVRGTVRDATKASWTSSLFADRHGQARYEASVVPDMLTDGAFDQAIRGVDAVVHVAAPAFMSPDPEPAISGAVRGVLTLLRAAGTEPAVKRFVLCSSAAAAVSPSPGTPVQVTEQSWNTAAVEKAWKTPREQWGAEQVFTVIMAMKTEEERQAWAWVRETKPGFVFNAVLPYTLLGEILDPRNQGFPTTAGILRDVFNGSMAAASFAPPLWYVDVADSARLHVAALIYGDVGNERIQACAQTMSWDRMPSLMRGLFPGRTFPDDVVGRPEDGAVWTGRPRAEELLRRLKPGGWTDLETSVKLNCKAFV